MEIILVLEIVLLAAAFVALNRALRQRVEDAARWEASVAVAMNRSLAAASPSGLTDDVRAPDADALVGYRPHRVQPAVM